VEVDKFWEEKEREIGEKVIYKCLAQYLSGYREFPGPSWGLFFFTKEAIYFQTFPKENWLSNITGARKKRKSEESLLSFAIPWKQITQITFPPEKSRIKKFFSPLGSKVIVDCITENTKLGIELVFNNDKDLQILQENYSSFS